MSIQTKSKKKITLKTLQRMKSKEPIVMITAYDALFAKIFDNQVDVILVGDSLNMSFLGQKDTLSATLEQMIYHTKAVCNGVKRAFVVLDMPFGSYTTKKKALKSAIKVYRESCADAIKIEGGREKADIVKYLTQNGIAVVSHIGLMPQSVRGNGGYIIGGKTEEEKTALLKDAEALQEAGAFMLLLEGMKGDIAETIIKTVSIPNYRVLEAGGWCGLVKVLGLE